MKKLLYVHWCSDAFDLDFIEKVLDEYDRKCSLLKKWMFEFAELFIKFVEVIRCIKRENAWIKCKVKNIYLIEKCNNK